MRIWIQDGGKGWAWMVLWTAIFLAGCSQDPFEIRQAPGTEACVQSLISFRSEVEELEGKPQPIPTLEWMEALARRPENLVRAVEGKKYIVHYYRRLPDRDEEIVPAKFPLFWEIDTLAMQTEGTYLVEFGKVDAVKITFSCAACNRIDQEGKVADPVKSDFLREFVSPPTQKICNESWCFSFRPRKASLEGEIGKAYLVRIEAQETYLREAKSRIVFRKDVNPRTYALRFTDPLEYRAMVFVRQLGIAMALSDKAEREGSARLKVEYLRGQIDSLQTAIQALEQEATLGNGQSDSKKQIEALTQRRGFLIEEKTLLDIELAAVLPRILVISPGVPCGK